MKLAIAVRHVHFEDLGVLEPLLRELHYEVRYLDAAVEDFAALDPLAADLVMVLGAPIGAMDEEVYPFLAAELDWIRRRLEARRPILGICLGAQIIARLLGAKVAPMGVKEIGFSRLTLSAEGQASPLALLGDSPVLHWHGDQFEIPAGASALASTEVCPNQAFARGREVLALQFHLEADPARIERWLVGHVSELGQAGIDPRKIRRQVQDFGADLAKAAPSVIRRWLELAGLRHRLG